MKTLFRAFDYDHLVGLTMKFVDFFYTEDTGSRRVDDFDSGGAPTDDHREHLPRPFLDRN